MSLAVVEYLGDYLTPGILPKSPNTIIICNEGCFLAENIQDLYRETTDIEGINRGNYLIKTSDEIQRGVVLSILNQRNQNVEIYTSRPEVISQYLTRCQIKILKTPSRVQPPRNIPAYIPPPQPKPVDNFDIIYRETLTKYFQTFLSLPIRANKQKSAKAQLKNIADGIIASTIKRMGKQLNVDSDAIVEAIFTDLEDHHIIINSASCLEYSNDLIDTYFGKNKSQTFYPKHRIGGIGQPGNDNDETTSMISAIVALVMDDNFGVCRNLFQVIMICKKHFGEYCEASKKEHLLKQKDKIIGKALSSVIEHCFDIIDSGVSLRDIETRYLELHQLKIKAKT